MNLLICNDDGIDAEGILMLADALADEADIYVAAPHTQRSAGGHGITFNKPVAATEVTFPKAKLAFSIEGTPADCIKMGLELMSERGIKIDKVFSGINHGGNLGTDAIYSGTVAAAVEGAINGIPSVAVSINARKPQQYNTARKLAIRALRLDSAAYDNRMILNINIPDLPESEIKGIKLVGQGLREYEKEFVRGTDADGATTFEYSGYPVYYDDICCDTSDVGAHQEGYVAITPLQFDLTNYYLLEKLRASGIDSKL